MAEHQGEISQEQKEEEEEEEVHCKPANGTADSSSNNQSGSNRKVGDEEMKTMAMAVSKFRVCIFPSAPPSFFFNGTSIEAAFKERMYIRWNGTI